ncbi:RNA 2',3'-cyclic phosphodiesterase [Achromobacter aloeverae]|uniref:RNA 2',3'-cyclic phosphodiesterase n=1 Tax=Achromobacter aloeverae TaxID=1750518 RepID=A0A4Q1HKC0_9BURK|nr:RNA 2',3'-cyclic phosphodiesterase [Achromobacter aloeverae]RXN90389.1 RNA 2',3'-cyclic phosphodiesterase [Achromobacter aloeverae]
MNNAPRDDTPAAPVVPDTARGASGATAASAASDTAAAARPVRLFFALWPDAATVRALAAWSAQAQATCGGRAMRAETLHLTLAFLGQVPAELVEPLIRLTLQRPFAPGTLRLDRYGVFPRQRIVWAGPGDGAPALAAEVAALWRDLGALGDLRPDHPFRPHVTLLRNADTAAPPPPSPPALDWHYERCVLVQSAQDGQSRYIVKAASR